MSIPKPIYRKDYKPSAYLIHTTELKFQLAEHEVVVSSKIDFYQNPKLQKPVSELFLNGVDLELVSIFINRVKPNYQLFDDGLKLFDLPERFTLEIKNRIHPKTNTSLNGLYQSGGNFCTQCEAHGFRQITYYLDRPDVLSVFTVNIVADKDKYPVLLSNGNLLNNSIGEVSWHDPTPKPCYLFALVAGDFAVLEDNYTTLSGKEVALKIYVEKHNISKTQFAMDSLKRAFKWDEQRFDLEYDLDIYMIVAVDDFNMGAMENKGLNIFNSTYVLADAKTATDTDFINIEAVIGHEYFHNWTGNRVTCRDWFQLSLKEGLTVFRDQEFTADLHSRSIKRIEDVSALRTLQFAEDNSPMKHPVRPESYIEMNNFYTLTVYEKGAEVIRMMHAFLGEQGFQKGIKLYFQRHDGNAVTIDDFVASMSDANNFDFSQFMAWYSNAGTPTITINNVDNIVKISQNDARLTPIKYGILDKNGVQIESGMLVINKTEQTFDFSHTPKDCTFSWLREFCAPVKLKTNLSIKQKIFLLKHDNDSFNQWDNAQQLWQCLIFSADKIDENLFFDALDFVINNTQDYSLLAKILTLPSEQELHNHQVIIDVFKIHNQRELAIQKINKCFKPLFLKIYEKININDNYDIKAQSVGRRALKNICLFYLAKDGDFDLAQSQFNAANCMSDKIVAFKILLNSKAHKKQILSSFYQTFKDDVQVMDKFFSSQVLSDICDVEVVKQLMKHELFSFNTPNRLRSVVGSFTKNYVNFHNQQAYEFFTDIILKLNKSNPQIGARLVSVYNHWRRFTPELKTLQKQQLEKIINTENLSKDIFEIVQTALK